MAAVPTTFAPPSATGGATGAGGDTAVGAVGGPRPSGWLPEAPSISLPELEERAALLTRLDRKYLVPVESVARLLAAADCETRVLEIDGLRSFTYASVYFDTADLVSYLLTAPGRRRRFKIRTRPYVDSGSCWVEVKTRGPRGQTIKHRVPHELGDAENLTPAREFIDSVLHRESIAGSAELSFGAVLRNRYQRTTLFLPAEGSRVTIDTDLRWRHQERELKLTGLAVLETKTGSAASRIDRLLWANGHRPTSISKYATALAALRPDLGSTRWARTLRRHFGEPTSRHAAHLARSPEQEPALT